MLHRMPIRAAPAEMQEARLVNANLTDADMSGVIATQTDFTDAIMRGAKLTRANLQNAKLAGVNLEGADLSATNMRGADLEGAVLTGAKTDLADFYGATLKDILTDKPVGKTLDALGMPLDELVGLHLEWVNTGANRGRAADPTGAHLRKGPSLMRRNLPALPAEKATFYGLALPGPLLQVPNL